VSLDFLDEGRRYTATIYRDGRNAGFDADGHSLEIETRPVSRHDTLLLELAPGGGQAMRIAPTRSAVKKPKKKPQPEFDVE
jgi:alpha-glucosidase